MLYHYANEQFDAQTANLDEVMKNTFDAVITTAEFFIIGTEISTFVLLFIFNSLINRSLADKKHEVAIQRQTE